MMFQLQPNQNVTLSDVIPNKIVTFYLVHDAALSHVTRGNPPAPRLRKTLTNDEMSTCSKSDMAAAMDVLCYPPTLRHFHKIFLAYFFSVVVFVWFYFSNVISLWDSWWYLYRWMKGCPKFYWWHFVMNIFLINFSAMFWFIVYVICLQAVLKLREIF